MSENTWTATTNASWIFFDSSHTLTYITGRSGEQVTVYVISVESLYDETEGTITIVTSNGDTFTKTIRRCLPEAETVTKTLTFDIYYGSGGQDAGPCENGATSEGGGIRLVNINLVKVTKYSDGETISVNTVLSENDVEVKYILSDGSEYYILPSNTDMDRDVTAKVTLISDSSISSERGFSQKGVKNNDGTIREDYIQPDTTGYTHEARTEYEGFKFAPPDDELEPTTGGCAAGQHEYNVKGRKITITGGMSAKTICDDIVYYGNSERRAVDIINDDATFAVIPDDLSYAGKARIINHNVLDYDENDSRVIDRYYTVRANLIEDSTKVTTARFVVVAGDECGEGIYIHLSSNKSTVEYGGGNAIITYYLSNSEEDDESKAITDEDILSCLSFICPSGVNCGEPTINNGVYKKTIFFGKNQNTQIGGGINWEFKVSCQSAVNNPQTITIYQADAYENLIPNCDYFVFNYIWNDTSNGRDLDSLTQITNVPNLMAVYNGENTNVSGKTIGFDGSSTDKDNSHGFLNGQTCVHGVNNLLYLKHGGDNQCSGAEGAIVCLKNILKSGQVSSNDIIYVDIYANWFSVRKDGNMSITYKQYSGLTENGNYSDEIEEIVHDDCSIQKYCTFSPKEGNCVAIGEEKTISNKNVKAYGSLNSTYAKKEVSSNNYIANACIGDVYTHVIRLAYNVAAKSTSLYTNFEDNGINTGGMNKKVYVNNVDYRNYRDAYTASTDGEHVVYDNVYAKWTFDEEVRNLYIFTDGHYHNGNKDYLECVETNGVRKRYTISELGSSIDLSFVHNFKVTKNENDTLKIEFDIDSTTTNKEFKIGLYFALNYGLECQINNTSFDTIDTYQKVQ